MLSNRCCNSCRQNGFGFGAPQMAYGNQMGAMQPMMECQVIEPTITQCQEREFYHEVPQV